MKLIEKLYGENVTSFDAEGEIPANLIEIMMSKHGYDMLVSNNLIGDIAFEYKKVVEKMFTGPDGKVRGSFAGKWLQPKLDLSNPKTVVDYLARLSSMTQKGQYNPNVINRLKELFEKNGTIRIGADGKLYRSEKDGSETVVSASSKDIAEQVRIKNALKPLMDKHKENIENNSQDFNNGKITKEQYEQNRKRLIEEYKEKSETYRNKLVAIRDTDDKDLRANKTKEKE